MGLNVKAGEFAIVYSGNKADLAKYIGEGKAFGTKEELFKAADRKNDSKEGTGDWIEKGDIIILPSYQKKFTDKGNELNGLLSGAYNFIKGDSINNTLSNINSFNVMGVLAGYYDKAGRLGKTEGLIERLDDKWDGGAITKANKIKIIESLIAYAKTKGLTEENSNNIKVLKLILQRNKSETSNTFNTNGWSNLGSFMFDYDSSDSNYARAACAGVAATGAATVAAKGIGALAAKFSVGSKIGALATKIGLTKVIGAIGGLGVKGITVGSAVGSIGAFLVHPVTLTVAGACALWTLFDKVTDNEILDAHLEALYEEIKNAQQGA